jgi:hypothetical protein
VEKRILLTRTRHDIGNHYLFVYSEEILDKAQDSGWKIFKVEDEKNRKKEIKSRLKKTNPDFVFFNGHGTSDSILGYNDEKIVNISSASILREKIVFARSCDALEGLGKEAVEKGCIAFIGHNGEFLIPHVNEFESTPQRDPTAKPVLETSNIVGKSLLKGSTVGNAVKASQRKAEELILKMLVSDEPYDGATYRALLQNYSTLSFQGDSKAKI